MRLISATAWTKHFETPLAFTCFEIEPDIGLDITPVRQIQQQYVFLVRMWTKLVVPDNVGAGVPPPESNLADRRFNAMPKKGQHFRGSIHAISL